jgi:hypothetical protein
MKRLLIALVCLIVAAACSSKKADEPAAPAAGAATPASAQPTPVPAPAAEPAKVEFTDALVLKYMEYQKQQVAIVSTYADQTRKNLASAKGDAAKILQQIPINEKLSQEMDAALKAKRAEVGLTEEQFSALQEAVELIANSRLLYNQMGGDAQLAKMEADSKKQIAALPEAQRAEAEKTLGDMSKSLRELKDGLELRKKYGDQAADVLLKHADDLARHQMEAFKLLGEKK